MSKWLRQLTQSRQQTGNTVLCVTAAARLTSDSKQASLERGAEEKDTYMHWRDNLVLFIVCGVFAR